MPAADHDHEFHGMWWNYGKYGPQDVHLHPCITSDEPGDCDVELVGVGATCGGAKTLHAQLTLDENGPALPVPVTEYLAHLEQEHYRAEVLPHLVERALYDLNHGPLAEMLPEGCVFGFTHIPEETTP